MEKKAREYHEKVEGMGGIIAAIEGGWAESETRKAKIENKMDVEQGKRRIVGVNTLVVSEEEEPEGRDRNIIFLYQTDEDLSKKGSMFDDRASP